jgi:hypothetical protein
MAYDSSSSNAIIELILQLFVILFFRIGARRNHSGCFQLTVQVFVVCYHFCAVKKTQSLPQPQPRIEQ